MSRSPRRAALGAVPLLLALTPLGGCAGSGTPAAAPSASVTSPDYSLETASPAPGSTLSPNPYEFGDRIDNPWLPLWPGTRMRYDGGGRRAGRTETVTVTRDTRMVAGVVTTVVRSTTRRGRTRLGSVRAYYAQDVDGNVWLFGVDRSSPSGAALPGSWRAGVHGAAPLVVMPAVVRPGSTYDGGDPAALGTRAGIAARRWTVVRIGMRSTPPHGHKAPVLESALAGAPRVRSSYAKGVGLVRQQGPGGRWELVRATAFD